MFEVQSKYGSFVMMIVFDFAQKKNDVSVIFVFLYNTCFSTLQIWNLQ